MQVVREHKLMSYLVALAAFVALMVWLAVSGYNGLAGGLFFAAGAVAVIYVALRRPGGSRRETRTDLDGEE